MKRKRSSNPARCLDNVVRQVIHEKLFKFIIAYTYIKELDLPLELQCLIMYWLKQLTCFISHRFSTFNTILRDLALENRLRQAFPEAYLTMTKPIVIGVRTRFELLFGDDRKNMIHITVYTNGSVVIQSSYYTSIEDVQNDFQCLLDPWYALYLHYKDWRSSFIK